MTDHTTMSKLPRLEVIAPGTRRRWALEEKQQIVAEALSVPRNVSATARRYGLSTGQLFTWCRLARAGKLCGEEQPAFAPALVLPDTSGWPARRGVMEIALGCGRSVRVDAWVDLAALKGVIAVLERR